MRNALSSGVAWLLAFTAIPAVAREAAPELSAGWHVVRPGDTLEAITWRYLGSPRDWKENWRLNPAVRDPDLLLPGERLRVLLRPAVSQPAAQVKNVRRTVDEMPAPNPWKPASEEDILIVRDGLRTARGSSVDLAFTDGTSMRVAEDSLVFLGASRTQRRWNRDVEIVRGQTDVATLASGAEGQVELVLGPALAHARGEGASGRVRARRPERGAQVMVFEGAGDVAAAGRRVDLPAGTGSSVPEQGPPAPAEHLLPAPAIDRPRPGGSLSYRNPTFLWNPVPGARSYLVELCTDRQCDDLVRRVADAAEARWVAQDLPVGSYFWRVTARSDSGLDGFSSEAAPFVVAEEASDVTPPTATLELGGAMVTRAGVRFVPASVPLEVKVTAAAAGVEGWQAIVNGQVIAPPELEKPWKGGAYRVTVRAADRAGNAATSPEIAFTVDDAPPAIEWQVTSAKVLLERGAPMPLLGKVVRDASRSARMKHAPITLTADGGNWVPVDLSAPGVVWRARSQEPQFFLLAAVDTPLAQGSPQLESGQLLWVRSSDSGAGVENLELQLRAGETGGSELVVTARDRVGNTSAIVWPLREN